MSDTTVWTYADMQDSWECSACSREWVLIDGTPSENDWRYCPGCGARIVATLLPKEPIDDPR